MLGPLLRPTGRHVILRHVILVPFCFCHLPCVCDALVMRLSSARLSLPRISLLVSPTHSLAACYYLA